MEKLKPLKQYNIIKGFRMGDTAFEVASSNDVTVEAAKRCKARHRSNKSKASLWQKAMFYERDGIKRPISTKKDAERNVILYNSPTHIRLNERSGRSLMNIEGEDLNVLDICSNTLGLYNEVVRVEGSADRFNFYGVEWDMGEVLKEAKKATKEKGYKVLNNSSLAEALFLYTENFFSYMFLDLKGTFDIYKRDLDYSITRNLVKVGGSISFTVSHRNNKEVLKYWREHKENYKGEKSETELAIKQYLNDKYGDSYSVSLHTFGQVINIIMKRIK